MNKKPKLSSKEDIFDVFRPDGDHDVSAENYRLKKQTQSQSNSGPVETNFIDDKTASAATIKNDPHTLALSGAEELSSTINQTTQSTVIPERADPQTTIRLETFRIGMEERLAAMQVAQQKAKDQLDDLEGRVQGTDKLPNS
jgi:hypothetical protein